MKTSKQEIIAATVYYGQRCAIVQEFNPEGALKHGIAKDNVTGELIYFTMGQCRKFKCGDGYPVFTNDPKCLMPKVGDELCFVIDPKPVPHGKLARMLYWNYETSYQECLKDCSKPVQKTDQAGMQLSDHTHLTATNGHDRHVPHHGNQKNRRPKQFKRNNPRSQEEKNWGYKAVEPATKRPAPEIDLCRELGQ